MAGTAWKGQLSFGLVVFPVRLYPAARRERVRLSYLRQTALPAQEEQSADREPKPPPQRASDGRRGLALVSPPAPDVPEVPDVPERSPGMVSRVKQELKSEDDERPVSRAELLRGVEVAPEQFVTFTSDEVKALRAATSPDLQILRSVELKDIDPVYFETSYFVAPDPAGTKAYALLFAALQRTQRVAVGKLSMHGREHVLVVRPGQSGLLAHTLFYHNEIRRQHEVTANVESLAPKEVDLATAVIEAIAEPFAPEEFTDQQKNKLETLITAKAHRQETLPSTPQATVLAPAVDIMAALQQSLKTLKKPPQPDTTPTPTAEAEKPKTKRAKKKA